MKKRLLILAISFLLPSGIGLNMNLDVYNKLPADVQQAMVKLSEDFAAQSAAYQLEKEVKAREMLTTESATIYNVPGAKYVQGPQPAIDQRNNAFLDRPDSLPGAGNRLS